jgi:DNA-binding CsgD family transcriptional regulator
VRLRDLAASAQLCRRALTVAETHGLTTWRIRLLFHLGVLDGVHEADPARLVEAFDTAVRAGAVLTSLVIQCELAIVHMSRADYAVAESYAARSEAVASRLRLTETRLIALALRVCIAGQRGDRVAVEELLAEFRQRGGEDIDHSAAVWGLGLSFCSMLEEDHDRAWQELGRAVAKENDRPPHYLSFNRGPYLLVGTLVGALGWAEQEELAASAHGQARWNHQFVLLARAVLQGREGHGDAAATTVDEFERLAEVYPMVHHLGLRLVAECAIVDGWGSPERWLGAAETYFHAAEVPRVTVRCRTLLREMGVRVQQRRQGSERIPSSLRRLGVTVREDEVLRLVARRLGNKEIARHLVLSPRTVEKHVASLLAKTGQPDRAALVSYALRVLHGSDG